MDCLSPHYYFTITIMIMIIVSYYIIITNFVCVFTQMHNYHNHNRI